MDFEHLRTLCLSFPGTYEDHPFGPDTAVFRLRARRSDGSSAPGKMFALANPDAVPPVVSLKCEPALAVRLRAAHPGITGAWHLDKKHWNGVRLDGDLPAEMVRDLVEDSYDLVVASLPVADRRTIGWSDEATGPDLARTSGATAEDTGR